MLQKCRLWRNCVHVKYRFVHQIKVVVLVRIINLRSAHVVIDRLILPLNYR